MLRENYRYAITFEKQINKKMFTKLFLIDRTKRGTSLKKQLKRYFLN